jgi:hypothetical protein
MRQYGALIRFSLMSLLLFAAFSSGSQRTTGYRWCVHPAINCAFESQQDCIAVAKRVGGWCDLTLTIEGDPARQLSNRSRQRGSIRG